MKRFAPMILAGLLAWCGFVAGPAARAQEAPAALGAPAGQTVEFSEEPSLLYATELIQQAGVYARAIAELSDVPDVEILQLSALPREDASEPIFEATVNRFTTRYSEDIVLLRDALAANPVVAEALSDAGVEPSEVAAAEIRPDLGLRVYVR